MGAVCFPVPELLVNIAHIGKVNEGELGHSRIGDERPPTEAVLLAWSFLLSISRPEIPPALASPQIARPCQAGLRLRSS